MKKFNLKKLKDQNQDSDRDPSDPLFFLGSGSV